MSTPEHVAIILDGNGRWAKQRNKARVFGHIEGAKNMERICVDAYDLGIKYLTVYAFSTENWKRSESEVRGIMKLLQLYINSGVKLANDNNICCRMIGDRSILPESFQTGIKRVEEASANNTGLILNVAINYGGRDEITRAVKKIVHDQHSEEQISKELINSYLDTADCPDPDLLIRTGGDLRISNFLLWQLAYTELYVTDTLWPDFTKADLAAAIEQFGNRDRRFGGTNKNTELK